MSEEGGIDGVELERRGAEPATGLSHPDPDVVLCAPPSSEDIDTLAAKACALASTPIPDYADSFARKDQKYKTKKYRDKDVQRASREDDDPNSIRLAKKTSNIMNEFQDYLEVIESQNPGVGDILEHEPVGVKTREGEETRGLILTEWNNSSWEDKYSDQPDCKRRPSRDRNLYSKKKSTDSFSYGDDDPVDFPGNEGKRHSYLKSALSSKRFKTGALWTIVAVVLLGVLIGTTSSDGAKEGLVPAGGQSDKGASQPGVGSPAGDDEADEETPSGEPDGDADETLPHHVVGLPTDEAPSGQNDAKTAAEDPKTAHHYQEAMARYRPLRYDRAAGWEGTTYPDAEEFCAVRRREICPFDAICPLGRGTMPLGGYVGDVVRAWVPIADESDDEWANLGEEGPCMLYSDLYLHLPAWGITGVGGEELAQHVMCCKGVDGDVEGHGSEQILAEAILMPSSQTPPALPSNEPVPAPARPTTQTSGSSAQHESTEQMNSAYQEGIERYNPRGYDRATGWEGTTYREASEFCDGKGLGLCPFDAVCPLGQGDLPLGGYIGGDAWVPVSDMANDWVNLGEEEPCMKYSTMLGHSTVGEGFEGQVDHVMCCEVGDGDGHGSEILSEAIPMSSSQIAPASSSNKPKPTPARPTTPASGSVPQYEGAEQMESLYRSVVKKYNPRGFHRASGWEGTTYQEASEFCRVKHLGMCPFDAICPLGQGKRPVWGNVDGWVPVSNMSNDWAFLGEKEPCVRYSAMPGAVGEGFEGQADHVICCEVGDVDGHGSEILAEAIPMSSSQMPPAASSNEAVPTPAHPVPQYEVHEHHESLYGAVVEKYNPRGFHRSSGWEGTTYQEASEFCRVKHLGICPFDAICPLGQGSRPVWGYIAGWVPVSDMINDWANLGQEESCLRYSTMAGAVGGGFKVQADHIMCCVVSNGDGDGNGSEILAEAIPMSSSQTPPALSSNEPKPAPARPTTQAYQAAIEKYNPRGFHRSSGWEGTTYQDASEFCRAKRLGICPFDAICPLGQGSRPVWGNVEGWLPVSDMSNDWAFLGGEGPCKRYSTMAGALGEGFQGQADHVMCCEVGDDDVDGSQQASAQALVAPSIQEKGLPSPPSSDSNAQGYTPNATPKDAQQGLAQQDGEGKAPHSDIQQGETQHSQDTNEKYHFSGYDRATGWDGNTYQEAHDFCAAKRRNLCPFDAMCPLGPGSRPVMGYVDDTAKAWIPVSDASNEWANFGTEGTCVRYSSMHTHLPEWGAAGGDSEVSVERVICCEINEDNGDGSQHVVFEKPSQMQGSPAPPPSDSKVQGGASNATPRDAQQGHAQQGLAPKGKAKHYQAAIEKHDLIRYDRAAGWEGKTYSEARNFCAAKRRGLCPFNVICPLGRGTPPVGGYVSGAARVWVPLSDASNDWANLGQEGACVRYSSMYTHLPEWGVSGEGSKDVTVHVMCCDVSDGDTNGMKR